VNRPTNEEIQRIEDDLVDAFRALRAEVTADYTSPISERAERALAHVETFAAISLRIMRKANPSKIRDAARAEEIKARLDGREVIDG